MPAYGSFVTGVARGRLGSSADAPATGELTEEIGRVGGVAIEQILSGQLLAPVDYDQAHDEWVAVLHGGAVLEVAGERFELTAGDWIFLPAHCPHRLVETHPGTTWLALHGPGSDALT